MNVTATIVAIDQTFTLSSGKVTNYVVLRLPSGREARTQITEEEVDLFIQEAQRVPPAEEQQPLQDVRDTNPSWQDPTDPFDDHEVDQQDTPVVSAQPEPRPVVQWEALSDEELSSEVKDILRASGVNPILAVDDLVTLREQILARLKKPAAGKVDWNSGPKRGAKDPWANRKAVSQDEAGNPIVPGGIIETDPGENMDDDDGVAQL